MLTIFSVTPGYPTSRIKREALQSEVFISTALPQISRDFAAGAGFQGDKTATL